MDGISVVLHDSHLKEFRDKHYFHFIFVKVVTRVRVRFERTASSSEVRWRVTITRQYPTAHRKQRNAAAVRHSRASGRPAAARYAQSCGTLPIPHFTGAVPTRGRRVGTTHQIWRDNFVH